MLVFLIDAIGVGEGIPPRITDREDEATDEVWQLKSEVVTTIRVTDVGVQSGVVIHCYGPPITQ
jgi:hypothetical protein